jgi:hypothetical protein
MPSGEAADRARTDCGNQGLPCVSSIDLQILKITVKTCHLNLPPSALYEEAIRHEPGTTISDRGALIAYSGDKTGRSLKDKRVVKQSPSADDIRWGPVNFPLDEMTFMINRGRAIDDLNTCSRIDCVDGYAGRGSESSDQDPCHLRAAVPCAVHAEHADPSHCGTARIVWRAGPCHLQRGQLPGKPLHDWQDVAYER